MVVQACFGVSGQLQAADIGAALQKRLRRRFHQHGLLRNMKQKISSALQLIIGYDGRKTGSDKVINTARAEIRALF